MLYSEHRKKAQGFADVLNYAALTEEEGIILQKDGAFLAGWYFEGPDVNSASDLELAALSLHINNAFLQFGDGWMLNVDMHRRPSVVYPEGAVFPDPTTLLIDEERRRDYQAEGNHYESIFTLTLTHRPPRDVQKKVGDLFFHRAEKPKHNWNQLLATYKRSLDNFEDMLSAHIEMFRMDTNELLTLLNTCISGLDHPVRMPDFPMYLDCLLGNKDLLCGFDPKVGDQHVRLIGLLGLPATSYPEILSFLSEMPCAFRWSNRFIFLDPPTAEKIIRQYRRNWFQKRDGAWAILRDALKLPNGGEAFQNSHALYMAQDADEAANEATANLVRFGLYTCCILLFDEDKERVADNQRLLHKFLHHHGFPACIEDMHAVDVYLGTLPGHGTPNVRHPPIHTLNLAHLLPLTSTWPGLEENPCPYFNGAPALLYSATGGTTPFRLNLHVSDVGHTLIVGPTGSGKSTLLGAIMSQFFRYPDSQVFAFDKGYSAYPIAMAAGAAHYDLAGDKGQEIAFYPLAEIHKEGERIWAQDWLETLLDLQNVKLTPNAREAINRALRLLSQSTGRTLTHLNVQDEQVRAGLAHYTITGGMPLLDSDKDSLRRARFQVFELENLMALGPKNLIPVLLYLFHTIERRLDGRPTLLVLDEAWLMLANSTFREKIGEWLRTLRKKNASVIFVTQSLSEIVRSEHNAFIIESCPTKIFLPNPEARAEHNARLYTEVGLTEKQIEIISNAVPKREYYYTSPLGKRLFSLNLGPAALAFLGMADKESLARIDGLVEEHGACWPAAWLTELGHPELANEWRSYAEVREQVESGEGLLCAS